MVLLLWSCSQPQVRVNSGPEIQITEISPNKWTALTRQNIEHLIQIYHLAPLFFTKDIHIQSRVIPHSHPQLTLNTRYAEEPKKLLAVLIHEQFHWWAVSKKEAFEKAIIDVKKLFPVLPKEGLAKDAESTYLHLIICYLEYEGLIYYLGKKDANAILKDFIQKEKIYPWIFTQVYLKNKEIGQIVTKFDLRPDPLKPVIPPKSKATSKKPLSKK